MAVTTYALPARYATGQWNALVTSNGTALLHPDFSHEKVQAVWQQLLDGGGLSGCLEVLADAGFTALPAFALVEHDEDRVRVLVRGEVTVTGGQEQVDAAGIATWRESVLTGSAYTITTAGAGDEPQWPIAAGIVAASQLQWTGENPEAAVVIPVHHEEEPETAASAEAAHPALAASAEAPEPALAAPAEGPATGADTPEPADEEPEEAAEAPAEPVAVSPEEPDPAGEPERAAESEQSGVAAESEQAEPAAESEQSGVVEEPEQPAQPESAAFESSLPTGPDQEPATETTGSALHSSGSQVIDSMPWNVTATGSPVGQPDFGAAPEETLHTEATQNPHMEATVHPEDVQQDEPSPAAPVANQPPGEEFPEETVLSPHALRPQEGAGDVDIDGDHDGETIMVSELPQRGMSAMPGAGDLYDEPEQRVLSLALSTGALFALDRPILIGRAPESARFDAGVQPRLVTVPSPQQDISRTHVEVRAEGSGAVVTDLNSTNGTLLMQPGAAPRRLHGGESASVPSGTTIDLGDGITASLSESGQGLG